MTDTFMTRHEIMQIFKLNFEIIICTPNYKYTICVSFLKRFMHSHAASKTHTTNNPG